MSTDAATHYRTCPLCEATCGLAITTRGRSVEAIRGDEADVFSHGFICPKGPALKDLDADPDRLRAPQIRRGDTWTTVGWDEAFAEIDRRLSPIIATHGRNAVGVYLGNPSVHNTALSLYSRALLKILGTRSIFSASTVDQMPKQVAVALMFGTGLSVPVPDVDRTDYLLILGADPLVSNGSLMTAPDMKGKLRGIRQRGGTVVVIDPRRSRTAEEATRHLFIRPGTDALLLLALVQTIFAENRVDLGAAAPHVVGVERVREVAAPFTPERVAGHCGIPAETIRTLARELASAKTAAVYGRVGTCTQDFGTLASWLVDVLNTITGNLDRPGGAMFPKAAAGQANSRGAGGRGKGVRLGRHASRVRGLPELFGELPVAALPEEIETPGDGQIRALVTIAGNPVLSTPGGARLARALSRLECMVSFDIYRNETTRHAHVILPGYSPLENSHYDVAFTQLAIRNYARYSKPVFAAPSGHPADWEAVLRLTAIVAGQGPSADPAMLDDMVATQQVESACGAGDSPIQGRDPAEILAALAPRRGPERLLDLMLRTGPYGDAFGATPGGLTLAVLEANPHGVDLGPLAPRLPEVLRTPSGKVELAPEAIVADVARLTARIAEPAPDFVLVGRRQLRSNNSWMHNAPSLMSGKPRCTLQMHPADAGRLALADGGRARVTSAGGSVEVPVEVTDAIMNGVVSIPHGWGHSDPGAQLSVAAKQPGTNVNLLADHDRLDPLSGTSVLNGIPVAIERVA